MVKTWKSMMMKKRRIRKFKSKSKPKGPQRLLPRYNRKAEHKIIDTLFSAVNVTSNNASLTLINGISEGTGLSSRIGKVIKIDKIELQLIMNQGSFGQIFKYAIIYDKQTNGVSAIPSDVFNAISSKYPPYALRNYQYKDRFVILKSGCIELNPRLYNPASAIVTGYTSAYISIPKGVATTYLGTGSTVSDIANGSIFLYLTSTDLFGTSYTEVTGTTRVKFTDD